MVGTTPVTTVTATSQYTGTVAWSGSPVSFAGSTAYTATITLMAKTGFTLACADANFFTVAGTSTVSNSANSGVVTSVFPVTSTIVSFISLNANGTSGTVTTTALTLTFDNDPTTDYRGAVTGSRRVLRGGGWSSDASGSNVALRHVNYAYNTSYVYGFRVVCAP